MAFLLRDPVIRRIPWRDLATLGPIERWRELLLPYFFLAGLRLVHDAFHANIGLHAERQVARTLRSRMKSALALGMFFHLEHHLFPRVPTCHLPALADRLERAAPELSKAAVY